MLGSAADAEDVLQETWLRWVRVDLAQVLDPRAYLVRITTRQALNRMRTMQRRRESYVGSWLPEPVLTAPDVAEDVLLSESLSMALMLVLESLGPTERAVFVLREVFDVGYDEIAAAVDKSPRRSARSRTGPGSTSTPVVRARWSTPAQTRAALDVVPARAGDRRRPGSARRARPGGRPRGRRRRRPTRGPATDPRGGEGGPLPDRHAGQEPLPVSASPAVVNGSPALLVRVGDEIDGVIAVRVEDARVTGLYYVRNPDKLSRVESETALTLG